MAGRRITFVCLSPEEVALLVVLFLLGVAGVGVGVNRLDRRARRRKLRRRGEENRDRAAEEAELRCIECGEPVDPEKGAIFDKGVWWCEEHWRGE